MSSNESSEYRSINEINKIFRNNFNQAIDSQSAIRVCNKGYQQIEQNSQKIVSSVKALSNLGVSEALQKIPSDNIDLLSLSDSKVVALKDKLAMLVNEYLNLDGASMQNNSVVASVDQHLKQFLLKDEEFNLLLAQDNSKTAQYATLGQQVVEHAEKRIFLGNDIEEEVMRRKKRSKNRFIALMIIPVVAVGVLSVMKPDLIQQYWQTLLQLVNK